ncbi:hypothetical protein ACFX15_028673 [Malus domestica]
MLECGANSVAASSESPPNPTYCTWCAHPEQVGMRSRHRLFPPQRLASFELVTMTTMIAKNFKRPPSND